MINYNIIAFTHSVARAYEIAKCGNHTVKLVAAEANADGSVIAPRDLELIRGFYGFDQESTNPDIIIEVTCSDANSYLSAFHSRCETIEDVNKRIDEFFLKDQSEFDSTLKGSAESLLKTAISKLELSFTEIVKILSVAETIARVCGFHEYKTEHIAEAIQYMSLPKEFRS